MNKIDEKTINEIAELLESGEICFLHEENGTVEHYPDDLDLSMADEFWQDLIDKIEDDIDSYIQFEKMDASQSFEVMSDFVKCIDSTDFKNRLEDVLNRSKPFRHFKHEIDNSDYREKWFSFRRNAYKAWVIKQL